MKYLFKAKLWKHEGPSGWYFLSLPKLVSKKIRANHITSEEGWGRLKARASIGSAGWDTALWFDTKQGCYLLPVKSAIRTKTKVKVGDSVSVKLEMSLSRWEMSLLSRQR